MREKKPYQVLTFHTTDAAMEMESFCKQNGIAGRLVPVPRRLSAGCGIAWRMEAEVYAQYQTVIADLPHFGQRFFSGNSGLAGSISAGCSAAGWSSSSSCMNFSI